MIEGVREIVLGMWLDAIKAGDRTFEGALKGISGALSKLSFWERSRIGWIFVEAALTVSMHKEHNVRPP